MVLGVGGLEDSEGEKWSNLAIDPEKRKKFVKSVVKFLNRWNFDGLQLAWQYPGCKQVCTAEANNGSNGPLIEQKRRFYSSLIQSGIK